MFRQPGDPNLFEEPILQDIARKYQKVLKICNSHNIVTYVLIISSLLFKSVAQIVLRWHVQRNTVPIPKAVSKEHIDQNIDLFDFVLSEPEMSEIGQIDRKWRIITLSRDIEHPLYPFGNI